MTATNKEIFSTVYEQNAWGSAESRSGPGSEMQHTEHLRKGLQFFLDNFPVKSFCDLPCGDQNWMKQVDFGDVNYIGCDIVDELIAENEKQYGSDKKSFQVVDIVNESCPKADVIFCRDLLLHLSHENVMKTINNFKKSGSTYLFCSTLYYPVFYVDRKLAHVNLPDVNPDVPPEHKDGHYMGRLVNLMKPPFKLPDPLIFIPSTKRGDHMGLWKLEELSEFKV